MIKKIVTITDFADRGVVDLLNQGYRLSRSWWDEDGTHHEMVK